MPEQPSTLVVKNIGQLLTMRPEAGPDGGPPGKGRDASLLGLVEDAVVVIRDGVVEAAGPRSAVGPAAAAPPGAAVIDASGGVVSPGLVDPHTHLPFVGWRAGEFEARLQGKTYLDVLAEGGGILDTVRRFRAASPEELRTQAREVLDRMLLHGSTTVEAKSGYGLTRDDELKALRVMASLDHPVTVVRTFLGAHAVPPEYRRAGGAGAYLEEVCLPLLSEVRREGLAEFCDVFCERGVFDVREARLLLGEARRLGLGAKLHADEIEPTGGAELAAEVGAVSADHLVRASDEGLRMMAEAGVVAVLLPATTFTLGSSDYAPARRMLDMGLDVALATDLNPGTSPVESLPLVMGLACRVMRLSAAEAFRAVTTAAAKALGRRDGTGVIGPGSPADLVVFGCRDYREVPYRLGVNLVRTVVKGGKVVVAEGRLVREGS
jgi:imidazolonepropionase